MDTSKLAILDLTGRPTTDARNPSWLKGGQAETRVRRQKCQGWIVRGGGLTWTAKDGARWNLLGRGGQATALKATGSMEEWLNLESAAFMYADAGTGWTQYHAEVSGGRQWLVGVSTAGGHLCVPLLDFMQSWRHGEKDGGMQKPQLLQAGCSVWS